MRLAIAATPEIAIPTLEWVRNGEHELISVITRPDKPAGRGKDLHESAVSKWAHENGVRTLKPEKSRDLAESLSDIDLVITIGYGVILPLEILKIPRFGFVNVHFSLLPAWRGAAPVQRAIENGDTIFGLTVFALDEGMDTGPIYVQENVAITDEMNSGDVLSILAERGPALIERTIEMIENGVKPTEQGVEGISYAKKLEKAEAKIDWSLDVVTIVRKIRAFTPTPGAWTIFRGSSIQLLNASAEVFDRHLECGEIIFDKSSVFVGCGDELVIAIHEIKPAGKRVMLAKDWANGARINSGETFG